MDINSIKELIKAVSDSDLTALQVREGNLEIKLSKNKTDNCMKFDSDSIADNGSINIINNASGTDNNDNIDISNNNFETYVKEVPENKAENVIKTPLVGTVYLAPAEDSEPFVKVGDIVKKGQTVAIVEAMKLMNDIEAEVDGIVKEILVQNGQLVEYGQPLFTVGD
ncbi:MAG: acetyl-CoA carboxylase biotin carboxyl carrier protein [Lachnospiraceae bacterium]|nr:acetyl-CoA carboxylase biotin carboxyl carrier protein [Lachnospiraceae bacterium]